MRKKREAAAKRVEAEAKKAAKKVRELNIAPGAPQLFFLPQKLHRSDRGLEEWVGPAGAGALRAFLGARKKEPGCFQERDASSEKAEKEAKKAEKDEERRALQKMMTPEEGVLQCARAWDMSKVRRSENAGKSQGGRPRQGPDLATFLR